MTDRVNPFRPSLNKRERLSIEVFFDGTIGVTVSADGLRPPVMRAAGASGSKTIECTARGFLKIRNPTVRWSRDHGRLDNAQYDTQCLAYARGA